MPATDDPRLPGPRLTLDFRVRNGAFGSGPEGYDVTIREVAGAPVLELRLPPDLVQHEESQHLGTRVVMSLDGLVSVQTEEPDSIRSTGNHLSIDKLVALAVEPSMLEDEPEAPQMMATLRDRLLRALQSVDAAVAKLVNPI